MQVDVLNQFNRINIFDSSSWKIPQGLKGVFPGFNQAGCKVQWMMEYKSGATQLLDITPENYNDQKYSHQFNQHITGNDLSIFDLGFSTVDTLKNIDAKQAFFICRLNTHAMNLYIKKDGLFHKLDILKMLKNTDTNSSIIEVPCYAGIQNKEIKIRLFVVRVPEQTANARRRLLHQNAQKKGYSPKEESLQLCAWNLFITNVPAEKITNARTILAFYPIRWTIELFFKQLKSLLHIHKTGLKNNPYRLRCEILGKSIVAMFISYCYSIARTEIWRHWAIEISLEKIVKFFKRHMSALAGGFFYSIHRAVTYIQLMLVRACYTCLKNRQKTRKNSLDVLIDKSIYKNLKLMKITRTMLLPFVA